MFFLPLLIDQRRYHVIRLASAGSAGTADPSRWPSFVVEREGPVAQQLFRLATDTRLVAEGGTDRDRTLSFSEANLAFRDGELVVSLLVSVAENPEPVTNLTAQGIESSLGDALWTVGATAAFSLPTLPVRWDVRVDGRAYEGGFRLHFAPKRQVYDVVMDFGSEATQVVMYRRDEGRVLPQPVELVGTVLDHFYPNLKTALPPSGSRQVFHQQEPDNERLYQSAFFFRKNGAVFHRTDPPGTQPDAELLSLLTERLKVEELKQTHRLVQNLKLAHLGAYDFNIRFASRQSNEFGVEEIHFKNGVADFQQAVVSYFVQALLRTIRRRLRNDEPVALVVRLLVPNVFDQRKVAGYVQGVSRSLDDLADAQPDLGLAGFEVGTVSESDASFLGYKRQKDRAARQGRPGCEPGKDYVVVDVGKGTVDYSILRLTKSNRLESVFRSGFVGAGNVISYAFVDTVFAAVFGRDSQTRRRAIHELTLSDTSDLIAKLNFLEVIEKLKKAYDHRADYRGEYQNLSGWPEAAALAGSFNDFFERPNLLKRLTELLGKLADGQGSLRDEFGFINRAVQGIVGRIKTELHQSGLYHPDRTARIVLTGRGFKFGLLRTVFEKEFAPVTVEMPDQPKEICLEGAFSGERINFDSDLVGFPELHRLVSNGQEKEMDAGLGRRKRRVALNGWFDGVNKKLETVFGENGEDLQPDAKADEENALLQGWSFKQFRRASQRVTIGGVDYDDHKIPDSETVNVFFSGEDFLFRNETQHSRLDVYPAFFTASPTVFQTLFPFTNAQPADVFVEDLGDEIPFE